MEYDVDDNDDNNIRYAGQYYDTETGTYYLRARYYNPTNGRFTQQDGWGFGDVNDPLSLNLYTYCMSNPILMVDINGHWPSWGQLFQAAAIVVGTVVVVAAVVATAGAAATAVGMAAGMYATALGATAATAGAVTAVATTAATVGAYAVAAGKVATAASNIGEVFTGHNVIRDDLMGGNQEAYDMLNIAIDMVGIGIVELGSNNNANAAPSAKADKGTTDNTQGAGNTKSIYYPKDVSGNPTKLPRTDGKLVNGTTHLPSSQYPHTQLGSNYSRNAGRYNQTLEWGYNGEPVKRIDWTDHGRIDHFNPHTHYPTYHDGSWSFKD